MKNKTSAVSLFVALGLLLLAILACKSGSSAPSAPITVSAEDLFKAYHANESDADTKYKGNTVIVTGTVGRADSSAREVTFVAPDKTVLVYCLRFAPDQAAAISKLKVGQTATVKGTCDGRAKLMGTTVDQVSLKDSVVP